MSEQSAIEWTDVTRDVGEVEAAGRHEPPLCGDAAADLEVLFALQLERLTAGDSHVGGRHGAVVRCPCCQRSACFIGGRRYAHGLRLLRHWSWTRDANGDRVQVLDVRPEWQSICVGSAERVVSENAELFLD
jgi:hypothetical protein